jgi:hypothetical protein
LATEETAELPGRRNVLLRMRFWAALLFLLVGVTARAQELTAADIMSRVAANQDRSEAARAHYVYVQHARTLSRKGKTIRCEEVTDYRILPSEKGSEQKLLTLDGRLLYKGSYLHYTHLHPDDHKVKEDDDLPIGNDDPMDLELVEDMRQNLTADRSKDGIGAGLFPLTSKMQADYVYTLVGRGAIDGRDCYHITFAPRDKDDFGWKGEGWIDAKAFQPVLVHTTMARNIPFAVRALLGTSVPGLGFTVTYAPEPADTPEAIWFPVSFGTEFKLHVLFFLNRTIVLDVRNRDFEQTHVHSTILQAAPAL